MNLNEQRLQALVCDWHIVWAEFLEAMMMVTTITDNCKEEPHLRETQKNSVKTVYQNMDAKKLALLTASILIRK